VGVVGACGGCCRNMCLVVARSAVCAASLGVRCNMAEMGVCGEIEYVPLGGDQV
jgi:hypothetical protein